MTIAVDWEVKHQCIKKRKNCASALYTPLYVTFMIQCGTSLDTTQEVYTYTCTCMWHTHNFTSLIRRTIKAGNDQEMVQSERNSHSKYRGEKK